MGLGLWKKQICYDTIETQPLALQRIYALASIVFVLWRGTDVRILHSTTPGIDYRCITIDVQQSSGISGKAVDSIKWIRSDQIRNLLQRWILPNVGNADYIIFRLYFALWESSDIFFKLNLVSTNHCIAWIATITDDAPWYSMRHVPSTLWDSSTTFFRKSTFVACRLLTWNNLSNELWSCNYIKTLKGSLIPVSPSNIQNGLSWRCKRTL